jgi:hypothetical protein
MSVKLYRHSQGYGNTVLDITNGSAKLQASYSGGGFAKGISVSDQGTVLYTLQSTGAVNGTGKGFIRSPDGSMVTYTFKGVGQVDKQGNTSLQGAIRFNNMPTGNLSFLSNMKGTLKAQVIGSNGQITLQVWQQK